MIDFILNDQDVSTDLPPGITVLDFVRYHKDLKGTKIGCREGDCGACTVLVGELVGDQVKYGTMTSCLMPLANASGKHIVTIEGINPPEGSLTPVQQALVDEGGTQCGFCTVGFVMSLTGFCIDATPKTSSMAISSIDGNICRCTGYKSIERAAYQICGQLTEGVGQFVPPYFGNIRSRLFSLQRADRPTTYSQLPVAGGTDVYVQKPDLMAETVARPVFYDDDLRGIGERGDLVEIGASATVTDLLESAVMQSLFPDLYKQLKLVSSTPIRNMATLAGNFVNASPIGDMTIWFLALDADITLMAGDGNERTIPLRNLYRGYKDLDKKPDEIITKIYFRKPSADFYFNFEKVCKRTYLDIATVNTAISLKIETTPGDGWVPPALTEPTDESDSLPKFDHLITNAHVSAGGVAPIPLYLKETSSFLIGRHVNAETFEKADEIVQAEISPISDVRGSADYKRLLLRQLLRAHFVELFGVGVGKG